MEITKSFASDLYTLNETGFDDIALAIFQFQAKNNAVYASWLGGLGIDRRNITRVADIPFLPISFFKTQVIKSGEWQEETAFKSSTTSGGVPSIHYVNDQQFYLNHARKCFEHFFGSVSNFHFFALLPSYLERGDSSLVAMIDFFIRQSGSAYSSFYRDNTDKLLADIELARKGGERRIIVWGVTYALLDLVEKHGPDLSDCLIFETGGMKGRRKELTRSALHEALKEGLGVEKIYSEYGMTELFSQAYTRGESAFFCPPWMRVFIREVGDPFSRLGSNKPGGLNVIDLANFNTVSFIETEDAGQILAGGGFEVQGRLDNSDIRGCNLMVE
ncbi:MAG: acyl transferase [Cyclobacteriaceae bacterium]|nr:acyl transferase [Cyclobacteriaceae bacterium]